MNYIGSKKSLLEFLESSIYKVVGLKNFTFLDLFAGRSIVGQHFKKNNHKIISNDQQYYSFVLNKNYIENHKTLKFQNLEDEIKKLKNINFEKRANFVCYYLDNIKFVEGFIFNNYCMGGTIGKEFERLYFSDENGKKADAIRKKIEIWKVKKKINDNEYYFLLATLLENIDKVANTASVYAAFLKKIKKTAKYLFRMRPANFTKNKIYNNEVFNEDIEILIKKIEGDVLYLDPPYNNRQYASNYHLLETIARYDNPSLRGKTGLRNYSHQKSKFSQKNEVLKSFENIIQNAKVKYIFLSYNNEGLMNEKDIKRIMTKRGEYGYLKKKYGRFASVKNKNVQFIIEYLHYIKCY